MTQPSSENKTTKKKMFYRIDSLLLQYACSPLSHDTFTFKVEGEKERKIDRKKERKLQVERKKERKNTERESVCVRYV